MLSAGAQFRLALEQESPLQIMGTINPYCALMAKQAGYQAIYLSGAGCANASHGMPDLAVTTLDDVLLDAGHITRVCDTPLLVDIDTGWESGQGIACTIEAMIAAGVAAVHIEDQVEHKRCGHRPNKKLVTPEVMCQRIQLAASARTDPDFFIIARTDAFQVEGLEAAIERSLAYVEAGADGIFIEALTDIDQFKQFCNAVDAPILANMTEFGVTPLYTLQQFSQVGVAMVLYPLTAWRAMNKIAWDVYQGVRANGSQKDFIDVMQTREELYDFLDYYKYEKLSD